ncbi:(Fe-S)-binding protein [archaeon]|nr:(Fe-S)-binding protein [archaeon]
MALFGKTVYYPGCLLKFSLPRLNKNYAEILNLLGISFEEGEAGCCGMPAFRNGYKREGEFVLSRNLKELKSTSKIITPCPQCLATLRELVPSLKIEHISKVLFENRRKIGKIKTNITNEMIAYFRPCVYADSLQLDATCKLLTYLGYEVKEIEGQCCGGVLMHTAPKISANIGKLLAKRFEGFNKIITSCPYCFIHLKQIYKERVFDLSEIINMLIGEEKQA